MGWAKERPPAIPVSIMDRLWTSRPSQTSIWSPRTAGSRGRLRISVPLLFGHVAMGRIAARFTETSTEVRLEIIAEDRYVDFAEEGYDISSESTRTPMTHWWDGAFCPISCCWWSRHHFHVR